MAQEFRQRLLRSENVERVDEAQNLTCMICLEKYGTINPSTGAVEVQIRLPCSHMVGSICISTWLSGQNSCPLCREEFFDAEPHQALENRAINVSPPPVNDQTIYEACDAEDICGWIANLLGFDSHARSVAISMSEPLNRMVIGHSRIAMCVAAISLYITWHIFDETGDLAAFMTALTQETGIREDFIRFRYDYIHCDRMELITPDMLPDLARFDMDALNWPARGS